IAERVRTALDSLPEGTRVVFTAHSIPVAAAERSPYVAELDAPARAVAARLGAPPWELAYQSRSGSPRDPWLEPDVNATLRRLAGEPAPGLVGAPRGFVWCHRE